MACLGLALLQPHLVQAIRNHQFIGLTPKDFQVNLSQKLRIVVKYVVGANYLVWSEQPSRMTPIANITYLIIHPDSRDEQRKSTAETNCFISKRDTCTIPGGIRLHL